MRKYFSRLPDFQRTFSFEYSAEKYPLRRLNCPDISQIKEIRTNKISCAHKPLLLQSLNTSSSECLMRPFFYILNVLKTLAI